MTDFGLPDATEPQILAALKWHGLAGKEQRMDDLIRIEPQPRLGKPFRIAFVNRGPEYWFNERLAYRRGHGPMLFSWKCPFGSNGEPVFIDGVWYWQPIEAHEPQEA